MMKGLMLRLRYGLTERHKALCKPKNLHSPNMMLLLLLKRWMVLYILFVQMRIPQIISTEF